MSVASALVAGNDPLPRLAERAFARALEKTGERQANGVLLFLTAEYSRHAQQTVTAVARAARCTQVAGGVAAGVFTDGGWVIDRPAAAVMVLAGGIALGPADTSGGCGEPLLGYTDNHFPGAWAGSARKYFGGSFTGAAGLVEALAWQQSRLAAHCRAQLLGTQVAVDVSLGWRLLGDAQTVDSSKAYALLALGGCEARESLSRALREAGHSGRPPPSALSAVLIDSGAEASASFAGGRSHPIAILDIGRHGAVTLAERVTAGQRLAWAIRLPRAAEEDMRQCVARLATVAPDPLAGVVFSCIGRGPFFHDGEDRDVDCLRQRFPRLPLIGTYGTGQIAPNAAGGNLLLQNAVVTALLNPPVRSSDVQSKP